MIDKSVLNSLLKQFHTSMPTGETRIEHRRKWFDIKMDKEIKPLLSEEHLKELTVDKCNVK